MILLYVLNIQKGLKKISIPPRLVTTAFCTSRWVHGGQSNTCLLLIASVDEYLPRLFQGCSKIQKTKMFVTCQRFGDLFYFGQSGIILQIRTDMIKVGSKSWLLTCSSNIHTAQDELIMHEKCGHSMDNGFQLK